MVICCSRKIGLQHLAARQSIYLNNCYHRNKYHFYQNVDCKINLNTDLLSSIIYLEPVKIETLCCLKLSQADIARYLNRVPTTIPHALSG